MVKLDQMSRRDGGIKHGGLFWVASMVRKMVAWLSAALPSRCMTRRYCEQERTLNVRWLLGLGRCKYWVAEWFPLFTQWQHILVVLYSHTRVWWWNCPWCMRACNRFANLLSLDAMAPFLAFCRIPSNPNPNSTCFLASASVTVFLCWLMINPQAVSSFDLWLMALSQFLRRTDVLE